MQIPSAEAKFIADLEAYLKTLKDEEDGITKILASGCLETSLVTLLRDVDLNKAADLYESLKVALKVNGDTCPPL